MRSGVCDAELCGTPCALHWSPGLSVPTPAGPAPPPAPPPPALTSLISGQSSIMPLRSRCSENTSLRPRRVRYSRRPCGERHRSERRERGQAVRGETRHRQRRGQQGLQGRNQRGRGSRVGLWDWGGSGVHTPSYRSPQDRGAPPWVSGPRVPRVPESDPDPGVRGVCDPPTLVRGQAGMNPRNVRAPCAPDPMRHVLPSPVAPYLSQAQGPQAPALPRGCTSPSLEIKGPSSPDHTWGHASPMTRACTSPRPRGRPLPRPCSRATPAHARRPPPGTHVPRTFFCLTENLGSPKRPKPVGRRASVAFRSAATVRRASSAASPARVSGSHTCIATSSPVEECACVRVCVCVGVVCVRGNHTCIATSSPVEECACVRVCACVRALCEAGAALPEDVFLLCTAL